MAGAREVELVKLLNAVVASASKAEGGDSAEEGRAVDALKALAKEPVTADLLSKTAAGKKVKKLCKHASAAIKAAATATVDAWMERVRQEQKAKPAPAPAPAAEAAAAAATGQSQEAKALGSQPSASGRPALSSGLSIGLESQDSQGLSSAGSLPSSSKLTTRPARCGDMTRDKIRDLLADALALAVTSETLADPAEVAVQVEEAMFQLSGEVNQKYKAKYRTLGFNLKDAKNPDLRSKVLTGEIPADVLMNLSADELGSDERRQKNDKIREHMKNEAVRGQNQQASTDMFQCSKCRQRKCTYYQMQTRSADEPMTTFVTCVNCNNRWKFC